MSTAYFSEVHNGKRYCVSWAVSYMHYPEHVIGCGGEMSQRMLTLMSKSHEAQK